jgi:isopentenyl diphosphate isomerase/L-lactate dehydrogenase-like FMN-dependent dehydrogenase
LAKLTNLSMTVFSPATMAIVKRFAGLTATSKGVLTVKDTALVPGVTYAAIVTDSAGRVLDIMYPLTAF